jgi:hypothetical protein
MVMNEMYVNDMAIDILSSIRIARPVTQYAYTLSCINISLTGYHNRRIHALLLHIDSMSCYMPLLILSMIHSGIAC